MTGHVNVRRWIPCFEETADGIDKAGDMSCGIHRAILRRASDACLFNSLGSAEEPALRTRLPVPIPVLALALTFLAACATPTNQKAPTPHLKARPSAEQTIPHLGEPRSQAVRLLGNRWRPEGGGVTEDKYLLKLGGQEAMLTLEYGKDAAGIVRVATVKFTSANRGASRLNSSWQRAIAHVMPIGSPVSPSSLSSVVAKDAQQGSGGERISFFMMPHLAFSNTRYYDKRSQRWKTGPCPDATPGLVMRYSDSIGDDEYYSEFLGSCAEPVPWST